MGEKLVELADLAVGSPPKVARSGAAQIGVGDRINAPRGVEPRGELVANALVLDEAVLLSQSNGCFVKTLRIRFPALQARDFRGDQGFAVRAVLWAAGRPFRNGPAMRLDLNQMLPALVSW